VVLDLLVQQGGEVDANNVRESEGFEGAHCVLQ
jgi:hypothetical protein